MTEEQQQVIIKTHLTPQGDKYCVEIYNKVPGKKLRRTGRRFSMMRPRVEWEP